MSKYLKYLDRIQSFKETEFMGIFQRRRMWSLQQKDYYSKVLGYFIDNRNLFKLFKSQRPEGKMLYILNCTKREMCCKHEQY